MCAVCPRPPVPQTKSPLLVFHLCLVVDLCSSCLQEALVCLCCCNASKVCLLADCVDVCQQLGSLCQVQQLWCRLQLLLELLHQLEPVAQVAQQLNGGVDVLQLRGLGLDLQQQQQTGQARRRQEEGREEEGDEEDKAVVVMPT